MTGLRRSRTAVAMLSLLVCACTSTEFRDREPFNPPPDPNSGFLGFFDAATKQTTCGNCHVLHQSHWVETAHADAWDNLVASGGQQASCNACHAVSSLGNNATAPAAYEAVPDEAYHGVQCESCHGPGFDHVQVPDGTPPPLARLAVAVGQKNGCAGCHTGDFSPFVEEWSQSAHGPAGEANLDAVASGTASCRACHEGRSVLRAWGVGANYVERDDAVTVANRIPQACGVCHDPHSADNAGQLRFPIDVPDVNLNLCMKCHQRRAEPDPASSRGPHSPQGPMLLGEAGYLPAGFDPDVQAIASTHGSTGNPRLCAGCHVNSYAVTDGSGQVTFQSTGHLFRPIPCLDPQGRPQFDNSCVYTAPARAWNSCTTGGCHATAAVAASVFAVSRQRMIDITNEIWADLNGNDVIDPSPTDGGLLSNTAIIPTSGAGNQYVTNDALITPAEGARFNVRMLRDNGADGSKGVHNPFFAEAVLRANLSELRTAYPGLPLLSPTVQAIMEGPLGAVTKRPLTRPLINPAKLRRQ